MNKHFFYESLKKNSPFFSAMLNFNLEQYKNFVPYADLENTLEADFLTGTSIKKYQKPNPFLFWDFADETKRLVLLDCQNIKKLARILGVSLYAEEISHILDSKTVLHLQEELGKELYFYALERGKFRLPARKSFIPHTDNSLQLADKIIQDGEKMLALCTQNWQEELKQIFSQKIQADLPYLFTFLQKNPETEISPAQMRLIWFSVKKLLLQEVNSSWLPYFN